MLKLLLPFVCLYVLVSSASGKTCRKILDDAGNSRDFGYFVGHALHSISLRTLQKFKPDVTEDNKIPTVNLDLTSDEPILPYAPNRTSLDSQYFLTEGMKILDEHGQKGEQSIASNIGGAASGLGYEAINSGYRKHDQEDQQNVASNLGGAASGLGYEAINSGYRKHGKEEEKPSNLGRAASGLGYDAINSEYRKQGSKYEQGIASNIGGAASGIGYDAINSEYRKEEKPFASNLGGAASGIGYEAINSGYRNHGQEEQTKYKSQFQGQEIGEPQFEDDELLQKEDDASTHLTNQEAWKKWKMVGKHDMHKAYDTATYLYCALN